MPQKVRHSGYAKSLLPKLKIFKMKQRQGTIERIHDERTLIGKNLFKKETRIDLFVGMKVTLSTGEEGTVSGPFGASGKYKVTVSDGLKAETVELLSKSKEKNDKSSGPIVVTMNFKRFIHDPNKKIHQD